MTQLLGAVNDVLMAGVGATAFALLLYLLFYSRQSRVARAFSGLLACVLVVYAMDLLLIDIHDLTRATLLLRLQWLGIAFAPTFYLEFVHAVRQMVFADGFPRWLKPLGYVCSALIALLALYTDWIAHDGMVTARAVHLQPGPLFFPFALLFAGIIVWGLREMRVARRRCHTRAARRRMTYLSVGFIAPALAVFPYLLAIGWPATLSGGILWGLLVIGNLAIAAMLVMLAYGVAFIGAFTPDRVIKHRLVRFLLRGPLTAMMALLLFRFGLVVERFLGLGMYTFSLTLMAVTVIVMQLAVELAKPVIDIALYREGREEVAQIQDLSQRLLTVADVRQFLESLLAVVCELLRSDGGFLAVLEEGELRREIWCGLHIATEELAAFPVLQASQAERQERFIIWNQYWVAPIYDKSGATLLGVLGLRQPEVALPLPTETAALLDEVLLQASAALDDRRLQQFVLGAFASLLPELDEIQRRRGMLRYGAPVTLGFSLGESPELPQWVHDALAHYWGGPRLTENPLLNLQVVQQAAAQHGGNSTKGLRQVLAEAIERLRPDGERKLTAPEWLLYNILEMKFLRGQKVREVAMRLAVSESDFYRKQRIAIENLAQILVEMEQQVQVEEVQTEGVLMPGSTSTAGEGNEK